MSAHVVAGVAVLVSGCGGVFGVEVPSEIMIVPGDYDGDGVDNTIDTCPMTRNDGEDFDNDGVGDACDDFPEDASRPGCLVLFDGFDKPLTGVLDPRWQLLGSEPRYPGNGSLLLLDGSRPTQLFADGFEATEIELRFYFPNSGAGPTRELHLVVGGSMNGGDFTGATCALVDRDETTDPVYLEWVELESGETRDTYDPAQVFTTRGFGSTGTLRWTPGQCVTELGDGSATTRGPSEASGVLGIRAVEIPVELDAIIAYSTRCP